MSRMEPRVPFIGAIGCIAMSGMTADGGLICTAIAFGVIAFVCIVFGVELSE